MNLMKKQNQSDSVSAYWAFQAACTITDNMSSPPFCVGVLMEEVCFDKECPHLAMRSISENYCVMLEELDRRIDC